ncbi:MAG TPA: NepR family anti-sigma factor [Sphingomonadales bacterium]|jgi:hypothetical protein
MADKQQKNDGNSSADSKSARERRPGDASSGPDHATDWVAEKLKELYGEVAREPLPENLLALLRQIDKSGEGKG